MANRPASTRHPETELQRPRRRVRIRPGFKPRKRPRARRTPPRAVPVVEILLKRRHLRRQVVAVVVGVFIHRLEREQCPGTTLGTQ